MKIAQVISTPPLAWATGGSARVVYDLSRELVNRGHEITIITTDLYEPGRRYTSDLNVSDPEKLTILRFPYFSEFLAWKKKIYISVGLIKYIRIHIGEYEIVHLQDLISIQAIFTAKYCIKKKIPYIISTHGSLPWLKSPGLFPLIFRFCFGKKILENATAITVLNEYEKQTCQSFGILEAKIAVLHNFIDSQIYTFLPKKNEFKQKFGIKYSKKILLYIGRIEKTKGLDLLIKVFADITKDQNNLLLVIIGNDDGYLEEIRLLINKQKITDNVAIIGYIDEKDKISAYIDADIMIYPRKWEPFGLTILEACACGTPVICSTRCGIAEYINNTAGITFNYNFESLKKAITELLINRELHEKLSKGGKQLIAEQFTPKKIVYDVERLYEKSILTGV
jgi:glycosyltransferase involved in cell wall biosynthesis